MSRFLSALLAILPMTVSAATPVPALSTSEGKDAPWTSEVTVEGCQLHVKTVQDTEYATANYNETLDLRHLELEAAEGWFRHETAFVSVPYALSSSEMIVRSAKVELRKTNDEIADVVEQEIGGTCRGNICIGTREKKSISFFSSGGSAWNSLNETMTTLASLQANCDA